MECRDNEISTKIKICGLYRLEDIEYANEVLPDYVGFIIGFPKSHRNISVRHAATFKQLLSKEIKTVGVFVNVNISLIVEAAPYLDIIQLHGDESNHDIERLRRYLPEKEIWKAFEIRSVRDLEDAVDSLADRVVLDNGYGTGKVFDWSLLEHLKYVTKSYILAGGLEVSNIEEGIRRFKPYAVDVSSGVEVNRCKDLDKMREIAQLTRSITIGEQKNE